MSQQSISDFLKANKDKWFTIRQIAKGLNISISTATTNCKILREHEDIAVKSERPTLYQYK